METMEINTWLFGRGRIIGTAQDWDGVPVWVALFPKYGRQYIRPRHED